MEISTKKELCSFFNISEKFLNFHLYPYVKGYEEFYILKKNGKERKISKPSNEMFNLQQIVKEEILKPHEKKLSKFSHGFISGRNIVSNAKNHINKFVVFNIDIKDFFPSINFGRVRGLFMKPPFSFNSEIATLLSQVCCYNNQLPQGSPTSPILSNFITRKLDRQLSEILRKYSASYSRYADDITISFTKRSSYDSFITDCDIDGIYEIIRKNGFVPNLDKERTQYLNSRQTVTSITVNNKLNIKHEWIDQLRFLLTVINKYGFDSVAKKQFALNNLKDDTSKTLKNKIKGMIAHTKMVYGHQDDKFIKFAINYNILINKPEIKVTTSDIHHISNAIFFLESQNEKGDYQCSNCFLYDKKYIIACKHSFQSNGEMIDKSRYNGNYKISNSRLEHHVEIIYESKDYDFVVLKSNSSISYHSLYTATSNQYIKYCNVLFYRSNHGEDMECTDYQIIGEFQRDKTNYKKLSGLIVEGTSGAPVMSLDGNVIGMIIYGERQDKTLKEIQLVNGFLPIDVIKEDLIKNKILL